MTDLAQIRADMERIIRQAKAAGRRVLTDDEDAQYRYLLEQRDQEQRRAELRSGAANIFNAAQAKNGNTMSTTAYRHESEVYNSRSGHDFVRDLMHNAIPGGSVEARKRVAAYQEEQEQRLTGMSVATDAAGYVYRASLSRVDLRSRFAPGSPILRSAAQRRMAGRCE